MIKTLLQEGFILKEQGHYKNAIEVFYKALLEDNSSLELLLEIAELFKLTGSEEKSLDYIRQILEQNPIHAGALRLLKNIFLDKKEYEKAEQAAKNILTITSLDEDLLELEKILFIQKKYSELSSLDINFKNPDMVILKANSLNECNHIEDGQKVLEQGLEYNPSNVDLLLALAKTLYQQNNIEGCKSVLTEINTEENSEILTLKGLICQSNKEYKEAEKYIIRALKLNNKESELYYHLASIYCAKKQNDLAYHNYKTAIILNPENTKYKLSLASLYFKDKHYKKALELLQGESLEETILKTEILIEMGYEALAAEILKQGLKKYPDNNDLLAFKQKINNNIGLNSF